MQPENTPFSILSLSGGGFRGLFTAQVLAELEREAKKPIGECFDLICGTSIGGILALAIGLKTPMDNIVQLMEDRGEKVFPRWIMRRIFPDCMGIWLENRFRGLFSARHKNDELKSLVNEIFEDNQIKHSHYHLMIPTVNYSAGTPQFFKTQYNTRFRRDGDCKMSDVAMATSAAPVFLPMFRNEKTGARYVDGGIIGSNPGLFGVHEAMTQMGQNLDCIQLLSIGTMGSECRADSSQSTNIGVVGWGTQLFSLTIAAQEKAIGFMMQHQLKDRYYCIDETPSSAQEKNIGLDIADKNAIEVLKSMADKAVQNFVGLPQSDQFLGHTANFKPHH